MVSAERQQIIETNKSLRLIKNELESLLEKGVIDEEVYDSIHKLLPAEGRFHGTAANRSATPTSTTTTSASPAPPTGSLANLSLGHPQQQQQQPPSYAQANPAPGPPPPPAKPVLVHARAMYRYVGTDARDCAFERGDRLAVHEYMNPEWWMGRNLRTGQEGIFPRNYVQPEDQQQQPPPPPAAGQYGYANEKVGHNAYGQQQNPYNSHVPPMAVAEQNSQPQPQQGGEAPAGGGGGKAGEMAGKFGKKLGNAAIFGAGATLGGNIVNSIF